MEYDIGTVYEAYKEDQETEPKYIHPYQGSVLYQITALMERNSLVIQVFICYRAVHIIQQSDGWTVFSKGCANI